MTVKNRFKIALKNLKEYKLRSLLTLMSIAVGVSTLISLIIISQSMERAVGERLGGTVDVIRALPGHVVPGRDFVPYGSFTEESAEEVEKIKGVEATSTWMVEIAIAEYGGMSAPVEVMGGNPSDIRDFLGGSVELKEGRLIQEGIHREAILSTSTLEHINRWLDADLKINDVIKINGVEIAIVGIMAYDLAGIEVSHRLLISKEVVKEITNSENVMLMLVKVNDLNRVNEIKEEIEDTLDRVHGVSGLTTAVAAQSVIDQVGMVTLMIQAVVVSIALIALFVGCLGIINVMLMSVMERTRQIGIMKAIGAKNKDILALFLVEASAISLIGGILGVIGGVAISMIANTVISRFIIVNMALIIAPEVLFGGIVVAVVTGIIGGLYPARRAARMKPVEALRHE